MQEFLSGFMAGVTEEVRAADGNGPPWPSNLWLYESQTAHSLVTFVIYTEQNVTQSVTRSNATWLLPWPEAAGSGRDSLLQIVPGVPQTAPVTAACYKSTLEELDRQRNLSCPDAPSRWDMDLP